MECAYTLCRRPVVNSKLCRRCLLPRYCSSECRTHDWIFQHKKDCRSGDFKLSDFIPSKSSNSLGKGAYGEVQLMQHLSSRALFAIKTIKKTNFQRSSSLKMMYREISVQKKLVHPNIIRLHSHIEDLDNLYLILEYAERGNLFFYIRKKKKLSEEEAFPFFVQVCIALVYLHERNIIHRDLKPENILLTSSLTAKLCDFGWCAEGTGERSTYCGTLDYMAPEILRGTSYSNKVDVWAMGVLLYEMVHGRPPFHAKSDAEKTRLIKMGQFSFAEEVSAEMKGLVRMLLQELPERRPSILTVLKHPWVERFADGYYKGKVRLMDFVPGVAVHMPEYGEGIIVNQQGLVCEISFPSQNRTLPIPELARGMEQSRSTMSTRPSHRADASEAKEEDYDLKLSKDYPPSYKPGSKGRPPHRRLESHEKNSLFDAKRGFNSTGNSPNGSPISLTNSIRSESSKIDPENMFSLSESSGSSVESEKRGTVDQEMLERRMKELESLQVQLEGPRRMIADKKKKKKKGFFARITGIFNIGCADERD
jgi:serine/threonine protein kinase